MKVNEYAPADMAGFFEAVESVERTEDKEIWLRFKADCRYEDVVFEAMLLASIAQVPMHYVFNDSISIVEPLSLPAISSILTDKVNELGKQQEQKQRDYLSEKAKLDKEIIFATRVNLFLRNMLHKLRDEKLKELRPRLRQVEEIIKDTEAKMAAAVHADEKYTGEEISSLLEITRDLVKLKGEADALRTQIRDIETGKMQELRPPSYGVGRQWD